MKRFPYILIASLLMIIVGMLFLFLVDSEWKHSKALSSIGLSLITAAFITLTLDRISIAIMEKKLNNVVEKGIGELKIRNYGLFEVVGNTPYKEVYDSLKDAKEFVLVQTWCPYMKPMLKKVESMVKNGGFVKMYLLHPECKIAKQRSLDLQENIDYVPSKIKTDTGNIRSLYQRLINEGDMKEEEINARLKLFYYVSLPAFALYKTDLKAWMGFYWYGTQTDDSMNLVVDIKSQTKAGAHILDHLKILEDISTKVELGSNKKVEINEMLKKYQPDLLPYETTKLDIL